MCKFEIYIRKKWSKDLPNLNIAFDKYKEGDSFLILADSWMILTLRNILNYLKLGKKNAKFFICVKNHI